MCGCRTQQSYQVRLPGGEVKVYTSEIAAKAKVKANPGAEILPREGASV